MYDDPQSLQPLLDMYDRDIADGLMDAPWPPVYPKQPNEPPRGSPHPGEETQVVTQASANTSTMDTASGGCTCS